MLDDSLKIKKKRNRIIFIVKVIIYLVVFIMYYVFIQIILLLIWLYTSTYKHNIDKINNQLLLNKHKLITLESKLNNKNTKILPLLISINKNNNSLQKKQKKILTTMHNSLQNDIISYWYYCNNLHNVIIKNKSRYIVNFDDINYNKFNIIIRNRLKKKINLLDQKQQSLYKWITVFYYNNCNQNTWFKKLVLKYFEHNKEKYIIKTK